MAAEPAGSQAPVGSVPEQEEGRRPGQEASLGIGRLPAHPHGHPILPEPGRGGRGQARPDAQDLLAGHQDHGK